MYVCVCVCVLKAIENMVRIEQEMPPPHFYDNQSSGEKDKDTKDNACCLTFQLHTPHVENYRCLSSMWLQYLTMFLYVQLNYSLCCKPNQHPVDSSVDHLHITATVVLLGLAKVLTNHMHTVHNGIFTKKPSGSQH